MQIRNTRSGLGALAGACRLGAATTALSLLAGTALAQTSLNPSTRVATPIAAGAIPAGSSVPPLPQPEALVPDGFGVGTYLRDHGIAILLDDVDEFAGNVTGRATGSANAGQYGLETDIDWERLAGLTGFSTHSVMVGRYGIPESRIFGDNLDPSQEIYGAGGNVAIHLVYVYGEETLAGGRVDIAAGRMPVLNDFASSPLYCNFMNNAFCGNPKASSDNIAYSSYPDANWAIRGRVRPTDISYVQAGLFFTEENIYGATSGYRSGFRFDSQEIGGTTIPVEAGLEPLIGPDKLPGHYKVGLFYSRNNQNENYFDNNGNAFVLTGQAPRVSAGQLAEYVLVDQMFMRNGPGATNGLIGFAGYFHNQDDTSTRNHQFEFGFLDHGFWKARPQDGIDVAFSYIQVANQVSNSEKLQEEFGLPLVGPSGQFNGVNFAGVQTHTMDIEANYQIHVYRGVTFAPDFQYFIRPNATSLPNAVVLGFKSHVELF